MDIVKEVLCYKEKDEMQTKRASLAEKESDSPLPNYLSHITPYQPQQSLRDYWGWGIIFSVEGIMIIYQAPPGNWDWLEHSTDLGFINE